MTDVNFEELTTYAKAFAGLTPEMEALLISEGDTLRPEVPGITENFYTVLLTIDKALPYLEGVVDSLKKSHMHWLHSLFDGPCDVEYTKAMYHVGDVHVKVKLPIEFMAGAMTLIQGEFNSVITRLYADEPEKMTQLLLAINAVLGYSVMVMQESYQASTLSNELDKFLKVSGISRTLFNNLAKAYDL